MPKKTRPIEQVLQDAATSSPGRRLRDTLPPDVYREIERDLQYVVDQEKRGAVAPSAPRLARHVKEAYGVAISKDGIRTWLKRVREGAENGET